MNLIKVNVRNKKGLLLPALNSLQLSRVMQKTHKDVGNGIKPIEMVSVPKIKLNIRKDQNGLSRAISPVATMLVILF